MKLPRLALFFALTTLAASAADSNWYLGAGGGLAEIHGGYANIVPDGPSFQRSRSTSNPVFTWNLAAGYRFSPYFAVEADYEQPSAINTLTTLPLAANTLFIRDHTLQRDLGVSLVGRYPLTTRLSLYAGAGLGSAWSQVTQSFQFSGPPLSLEVGHVDRQFWRAQMRAGAEFSLTHALALRLGWDRPDASLRNWRGYNPDDQLSIDNFSATAVWAF